MNCRNRKQKIKTSDSTRIPSDNYKLIHDTIGGSHTSYNTNCKRFINHCISQKKQSQLSTKKPFKGCLRYNECYCNVAKYYDSSYRNNRRTIIKPKLRNKFVPKRIVPSKCNSPLSENNLNSSNDFTSFEPELHFNYYTDDNEPTDQSLPNDLMFKKCVLENGIKDFDYDVNNEENHRPCVTCSSLRSKLQKPCKFGDYNVEHIGRHFHCNKFVTPQRNMLYNSEFNCDDCIYYDMDKSCKCNIDTCRNKTMEVQNTNVSPTTVHKTWVQELAKYRNTHWFDCHFYDKYCNYTK